jgi:hypothetical protein
MVTKKWRVGFVTGAMGRRSAVQAGEVNLMVRVGQGS